ncbi:MAG: hypothetical protein AAGE01_22345 [Pseudomonadota bacterium]
MRTQWRVGPAEGLDALLLLGAAAGDELQSTYYGESITLVRGRMSADGVAALDEIHATLAGAGRLVGPSLALYFSAGPIESLEAVIRSAADPVTYLREGLGASPYWDPVRFDQVVALMPVVHRALVALRDIGFVDWYRSTQLPEISASIERNLAAVSPYDLIPEQERLLGRPLDSGIELIITRFAQPYGIRILGQRFVAYHGWKATTQLHVAAHEIFHPPFDLDDAELLRLLEPLREDPWLTSIVENHDPKFGYNSFMGVINEGATQALDQIVADRLGFARDPGQRWRHADGGMHLFAAALYHAMREDGFADAGGSFETWFLAGLRSGLLAPERVQEHAAAVVGEAAVARWRPDHVAAP